MAQKEITVSYMGELMKKFWNPAVNSLTPYLPGEQPNIQQMIKLNTNENPYPPSPACLDAIRQANDVNLRLYPDPEAIVLRNAIADLHGLSSCQVFVGNGSDEVLALLFFALLKHEKPILFPDITYSFYPVYCDLYEISYRTVPLDDCFKVNVADYRQDNGGIVLANPNAPTGIGLGLDELRVLLTENRDSVVVIDEAYIDFGGQSAIPLIEEFANLVVVQTFSKSRALAGLRVGFAIAHPDLIMALNIVKGCFNSYPLDRLAQAGAVAALLDQEYFEMRRKQVIASRNWLAAELRQRNFKVLPSQANFLFVRPEHGEAAKMQNLLRGRNILVRYFSKPRIDSFLRITIGTQQQCQALVEAVDALSSLQFDGC